VKYFVRKNHAQAAEGPFDLERARRQLRTSLREEHGLGHAVHEGQRGIWLVSSGDNDPRLVWIADEHEGVVRLNDGSGQASFLH